MGLHTYVLDGDGVRTGLNKDLGFTPEDRAENVRRVAETAKLMADAGLIVIVSLVSPFRGDRRAAKGLFDGGRLPRGVGRHPGRRRRRARPEGPVRQGEGGHAAQHDRCRARATSRPSTPTSSSTGPATSTTPSSVLLDALEVVH